MAFPFDHPRPPVPSGSPWWMGVLPWAVYGLGRAGWPVMAAPLTLGTSLLVTRWAKIRWNALDLGVMAYFFILSIISITGQEDSLPARIRFALCPAVLAVAVALSVASRRPFTLAYARDYAPAYVQERPAFFWANQLISLLWAAGFALAATLIGYPDDEWTPVRAAIILIAVLGATAAGSGLIGLWFHLRESRATT